MLEIASLWSYRNATSQPMVSIEGCTSLLMQPCINNHNESVNCFLYFGHIFSPFHHNKHTSVSNDTLTTVNLQHQPETKFIHEFELSRGCNRYVTPPERQSRPLQYPLPNFGSPSRSGYLSCLHNYHQSCSYKNRSSRFVPGPKCFYDS